MKTIIYFLIAVMLFSSVAATIDCSETMTASVPDIITDDFNIVLAAQGVTGKWGVSIELQSYGCLFDDGTTSYKGVLYSEDGTSLSIPITVPEEISYCTFNGDYKYGDCGVVDFSEIEVTISCTSGTTRDCTADNACPGTQTCTNNAWGDCVTSLVQCQDGTCQDSCPDPTCDEVCGEWTDWSNSAEECGDKTRTCPEESDCTTTMTKTCPAGGDGTCEWYEKNKDGVCEPNIMLIVMLFFAAVFFMRMMGG